jgi:DNA-binding Lrp family transcriptional regulator
LSASDTGFSGAIRADELARLRMVLEQARRERRTLSYLEVADRMGLEPPQRIHRVTRLLELLLNDDVRAGRPLLAALAVSRVRDGLPAPGFFERLRRLGLEPGEDRVDFHGKLLEEVFNLTGNI